MSIRANPGQRPADAHPAPRTCDFPETPSGPGRWFLLGRLGLGFKGLGFKGLGFKGLGFRVQVQDALLVFC